MNCSARLVAMGAPLMQAEFPRAWLDLNREPYELDPEMFHDPLPGHVNTSSVRVAGGLGTIPRIVSEGEEIYAVKLDWKDAQARIQNHYVPYHEALRQLMADTYRRFGTAILVDCHSMPSVAGLSGSGRPDIVLGDRHGTSCDSWITQHLEEQLRAHGLKVSRNRPYAGGYITQRYGRPRENVHAVQIEINRMLYMNETTLKKSRGFSRLQTLLLDVMSKFLARARDQAVRPQSPLNERPQPPEQRPGGNCPDRRWSLHMRSAGGHDGQVSPGRRRSTARGTPQERTRQPAGQPGARLHPADRALQPPAQVCGYAILAYGFSLEFGGRDAFLDEFYIDEQFRGRGIGKAAPEAICQWARDTGLAAVHLEVEKANTSAKALYANLGFEDREHYHLMSLRIAVPKDR
jgi:N-formylglutamate amidohydrolase/GNAT superfamily N-acetyltransferase